jgi:hypothetical protein
MGYFEFLDAVLEEEVETPGGTHGNSRGSVMAIPRLDSGPKSVSAA